jgi:hypothetical protein
MNDFSPAVVHRPALPVPSLRQDRPGHRRPLCLAPTHPQAPWNVPFSCGGSRPPAPAPPGALGNVSPPHSQIPRWLTSRSLFPGIKCSRAGGERWAAKGGIPGRGCFPAHLELIPPGRGQRGGRDPGETPRQMAQAREGRAGHGSEQTGVWEPGRGRAWASGDQCPAGCPRE